MWAKNGFNWCIWFCFNCRDLVIKLGLSLKRKVDTWKTCSDYLSCCASTSSGCLAVLSLHLEETQQEPNCTTEGSRPQGRSCQAVLDFLVALLHWNGIPIPPTPPQICWTLKENLITNFCQWNNLLAMSLST